MKTSINHSLAVVGLLAALTISPRDGHAESVTFQVRMSQQIVLGNFDPAADFVDLAGSFNGWGASPMTPLSDADGDSIYEVTVDGFTPSEVIYYKFRRNATWDGTEEFPGAGNDRQYTVQPGSNEILVWYYDVEPQWGSGELHWWNDTVFYEIFVRSFHDSDGDGIGDLQGLIQKLDYLNDGDPSTTDDLGITGIWLMPIHDSPSTHGYDTVDHRSINPDYGTLADFQAFLSAAQARGIKVIIDLVMNHCSDQHPWFTAAALNDPVYRDYFRWSPTDPGYTGPWGQTVWHYDASGWYYGLFESGAPDLNYGHAQLRTWMLDTATYWLDTIGVDGFRLDAVLFIDEDGSTLQNTPETFQFWQDYKAHVEAVKPEALSVAEAWVPTSAAVPYVIDDRMDLCFEFDLAATILDVMDTGYAGILRGKADQVYSIYPHLQFATFLGNHDQDRSFTRLGEDEARARVAAGILMTLPGVPFLYYGEEIGMIGAVAQFNIRRPMQWTAGPNAGFTTGVPWAPVNGNYPQYNVAVEEQDPGSLLEWTKRLIHLRGGAPALRRGDFEPLMSTAPAVLAFLRSDGEQTLICLANTASYAQAPFTLTDPAETLVPGGYPLVNLLDAGDTPSITVTPAHEITGLSLAGHEVAVYELPGVTSVDGRPSGYAIGPRIESAHPNPFSRSTTIRYSLAARSPVRLSLYNVAGREVGVLVDGEQVGGTHEAHWDGSDRNGSPLAAGIYFVRLDAGGETRLAKIMLMR